MFRISYGYNQNQGDDDLVDNISTAPANSKVVQLKDKGYGKTKMQTLKSLNHMMKLYHVTVNNRIYLTGMIVVNHNLLFQSNSRRCSRPGVAICNAILSCYSC